MKVKLGDIAVFINGDRGKNYPSQADIMETGEVPFVNAGHLTGREVCFDDMNYISKEKYDSLNAGKFHRGDILYCLRGSLGKKALVKAEIEGAIASSLVIIRTNDEIVDRDYLMLALDSPAIKEQLIKANNGSSQPNLSAASVKQYEIDLPNICIQADIAERLLKARTVIDIRKQELQKLDDLIKARFVELFGDPVSNTKGLDKVALDDCVESIDNGKSFICDSFARIDEKPAILKLSAATYGVYKPDENKAIIDENDFVESAEVCAGDLLFTRKNTPELVGMAAYVYSTPKKLMMPDLIFRINTKQNCRKIYLWKLINHDLFRGQIKSLAGGSAKSMSNISKERLGKLQICLPPLELQIQFEEFVKQTDKSKVAVQKALDEAQLLFDSLMQKYFG